jgi:CubicO group peptidase (beta-lactamase class C family)
MAQALESVRRVPGAFPAVSAVIVQGEAAPWIFVRGRAHAGVDVPADAGTRFYIASQTKSFMGLLGAVLDRKGVLRLDTTLASIWPSLQLPAPADPHRITLADLLSHQEGLRTDTLNFLSAYVRDVPARDYPRLLATETASRAAGFRYANLGDLVYGAALQARTGRNWHDWLDAEVLQPLALSGVSSRSSSVAPAQLAWNHQWDGTRWRAFAPKPDALMHAAGGLLASSHAMATWMQANLGIGDARGALEAVDFERAQKPVAHAHLADGEIDCDGYSLGWYSCRYKGQRALMHPGSYVGTVSVTVLVPAAHAGLSLVVNSDSAMEGFELEVMKAFIGLVTGQPGEAERLHKAVAAYPARLHALTRKRLATISTARADSSWGGWTWAPDAATLQACTGRFANVGYGSLVVNAVGGHLVAHIGAMRLSLEPAHPGLFGASSGTLDPPEAFECDGRHRHIRWRGRDFQGAP